MARHGLSRCSSEPHGACNPSSVWFEGKDTVDTRLIKPETFAMPWKMAEVDAPRCTIVTSVSCSSKVHAQTCGAKPTSMSATVYKFQTPNTLSRLLLDSRCKAPSSDVAHTRGKCMQTKYTPHAQACLQTIHHFLIIDMRLSTRI